MLSRLEGPLLPRRQAHPGIGPRKIARIDRAYSLSVDPVSPPYLPSQLKCFKIVLKILAHATILLLPVILETLLSIQQLGGPQEMYVLI